MAASELVTFIFKFKNLWRAGLEAKLSVNCRPGQALFEYACLWFTGKSTE